MVQFAISEPAYRKYTSLVIPFVLYLILDTIPKIYPFSKKNLPKRRVSGSNRSYVFFTIKYTRTQFFTYQNQLPLMLTLSRTGGTGSGHSRLVLPVSVRKSGYAIVLYFSVLILRPVWFAKNLPPLVSKIWFRWDPCYGVRSNSPKLKSLKVLNRFTNWQIGFN